MKKVWKGFAAAVSAAAIAATGFIGATSAYAATGVPLTTKNTITIKNAHAGDVFEGYRILNLESQAGDQYIYLVNKDFKAQTVAGIRAVETNWKTGTDAADIADSDIIAWITGSHKEEVGGTEQIVNNLNANTIDTFAIAFVNALNSTNPTFTTPAADINDADKDGNITVTTDQQVGYYLISQKTIGNTDKYTATRYLIGTNGTTTDDPDTGDINESTALTVTLKNGGVTLEKKTQDINDSTEDAVGDLQDSADYDLGDDVPFTLTGTLPEYYDGFDTFKYEFKDILSKGLTFKKDSVKVFTLNGDTKTEIKEGFAVSDAAEYKGTTPAANTGDTFFTVTFDNLKNAKIADESAETGLSAAVITSSTKIIVEYKATLNNQAVIGDAGNPNKALLSFSNNPYVAGDGTTPVDTNIIFTYDLAVDKTDDKDAPLAGAGFTLYKFIKDEKGSDEYNKVKGTWTKIGDEVDAEAVYKQNEAGRYLMKDTDGNDVVQTNAEGPITDKAQAKPYSYTAKFERIDDGVYKLVETKVPSGYNKADDVIFTITAGHTNDNDTNPLKLTSFNVSSDTTMTGSNGNVAVTIVNTSGNKLPETGGMGTTVLYVAGAAIVLIAGIGLAVALRRRQA